MSRGVGLALLLIAAGVAVASATELHFDALGLAAALSAAALLSLQHLYSKRVMRETGVHHLRLLQVLFSPILSFVPFICWIAEETRVGRLQRLSQLALVMFLPLWLWHDGAALLALPGARADGGWGARVAALVGADGALAWLQAVAAFSVLSRVTPLTYAVASAAKRAVVVAASLLLLRNPAPPLNVAGMALAALGVLVYNRAKYLDRAAPDAAKRPLLPV